MMEKPAAGLPNGPPESVQQFADKADNLDFMRKGVEDAASVSTGIWLSYLFALFYFGIAAGAVTYTDLLLENSVKLPFLNIELPLVAFFALAPILFVIIHAYTLVHFVILAAKVGYFTASLSSSLPMGALMRRTQGMDCGGSCQTIFLCNCSLGQWTYAKVSIRWFLKGIAWVSLVFGPVLLLLLFQVRFLPYHLWWVTWVQRFAVFVDVILLWLMWSAVVNGRSKLMWRLVAKGAGLTSALSLRARYFLWLVAAFSPIGFAFTAATFPGEWLDDLVGKIQWIPPNSVTAWLGARQIDSRNRPVSTSFHDLLFNGQIDVLTLQRKSLFSNTLMLPWFDVVQAAKIDDPKKLSSVKHTLSLRGRHLENAILVGADLRKADLKAAQLQGANFFAAQLQDADLQMAQLQGANLSTASLHGASLCFAKLQGASLVYANLQGAPLYGAQLQGASLNGAQLQGVSLGLAHLEGASLRDTQLQGVSLENAQLQGADFQESALAGTNMSNTALWRTNFKDAKMANVFEDGRTETAISKNEFAELKAAMKDVPGGPLREEAIERIEKLNPDVSGSEVTQNRAATDGGVDGGAYQKALAFQLESLVCSWDESSSYVVRGLATTCSEEELSRIAETGPYAPDLIDSILAPACPVSATLADEDKAQLKKLAKVALASESKQ